MDPRELWSRRAQRSFVFWDYEGLVTPTGLRAANLRELLNLLRVVPPEVLHHHLYRSALYKRYEVWDYPNDFARWAADALEDHALAEKFAALDPYAVGDLERVREHLLDLIEDHLEAQAYVRWVRPGLEFHFSSGHYMALPGEREVWTLPELQQALAEVPLGSIYYHFHEARLRGPRDDRDDFSRWIEGQFGSNGVVEQFRRLDFYFYSLEDLRARLVGILDEAHREAMSAP